MNPSKNMKKEITDGAETEGNSPITNIEEKAEKRR